MTINIGLLGAGRIGLTHARAVAGIAAARIAAVFDPNDAAAQAAVDLTGARRATVAEIMADPAIDAVMICTPTDLHADQVEQAAQAGKAIFCEKPIDLDVARVRACLKVVERAGARLMIGFNRRFDREFVALRAQIEAGAVGAFLSGSVEIGVARDAGLDRGVDIGAADLPVIGRVRYPERPADAMQLVGPAFLILGLLEVGQHVVPCPADVAELAPIVVVAGLAADVDQAVDR